MEKCQVHPKYKGTKKPRTQCEACLALYITISNRPRAPIIGTKVFKDKSKYTRKQKDQDDEL